MKGSLGINILFVFCQILLDDPFYKRLVFTEHPYVQCLNSYNGIDKGNCVEKPNGLATTLSTGQNFCRMVWASLGIDK